MVLRVDFDIVDSNLRVLEGWELGNKRLYMKYLAYKKKHKGLLPKLNISDESNKLPWNDGNKFRDEDIKYVEEKINILKGFSS